jgi:predicted nucleic acid-binding protein
MTINPCARGKVNDPVESFARAARIYFDCKKKGITIRSTIDCLIAQTALEHDLFLLHNDTDFDAMASVIRLKIY